MTYKKINVLMGIYNCEATLSEAIDCLLAQTYEDWLLIMCDDGSTDNTYQIACNYQERFPDKIVVLKNQENKGLNYTLNKCLSTANCEYIARMDGDDTCSPDRFQIEIDVLENEPSIAVVSTDMDFFDESGIWGQISHPEYPEEKDFLAGSPFCHAPCMVRKEALDCVNGYSESKWLLRVEDYHLWMKLYQNGYRGKNIHTSLYAMRDDRNAYSRRKFKYRINEAYVKLLIMRNFKLPVIGYIHVLRPIIVGLLPAKVYDILHKWNLRKL